MAGAVLNTINIRLDANTISYILDHSDAKVLVVDRQLHREVKKALKTLNKKIIIIDIDDKNADQSKLEKIGDLEYESFLNTGDENFDWQMPEDEWQAISLSLMILLAIHPLAFANQNFHHLYLKNFHILNRLFFLISIDQHFYHLYQLL